LMGVQAVVVPGLGVAACQAGVDNTHQNQMLVFRELQKGTEPKAIIEDSGSSIPVALAKDNFAKSLRAAIEAVAGKGRKVKAVDSSGVYPQIEYMGN